MTCLHVDFHQCSSISHIFIHCIDTERLPRKCIDQFLELTVSDAYRFKSWLIPQCFLFLIKDVIISKQSSGVHYAHSCLDTFFDADMASIIANDVSKSL